MVHPEYGSSPITERLGSATTTPLFLGGDGVRDRRDSDSVPRPSHVTVVRPLGPLDLGCHRHEGLLDVCGVFCTCLQERDLKLICKLLEGERGRG